jgi:hypothetical protein
MASLGRSVGEWSKVHRTMRAHGYEHVKGDNITRVRAIVDPKRLSASNSTRTVTSR